MNNESLAPTSQVIARPSEAIETLFAMLDPHVNAFTLAKGQRLTESEMSGFIYLFYEGRLSLIRDEDELYLGHTTQKAVLGIIRNFHPLGQYTYRADLPCRVGCIPASAAFDLINQNNLWMEITRVLSYHLFYILKRDNRLTGHDSYTIIRNLILELMQLPEDIRRQLPLASYIQKYAKLSRSNIMRILRELKNGNYIETERGVLIKVNNLPEKY
ncbi:helix-turn-helix domain-containing protein [Atlantibacter hermannii]|uniref:helix-turn-helix domain-containing protein n=1 Tax=Atlantibacter hermannii TaxID=565 RepID=UPI00193416D7|nr:helix-turn-helix domain-containing protein [Atlantibacter hermannii]MBL7636726.1 helix-turn-helix domain-containing protein [Atlantibacter hermannii]MBL7673734.1 helix-turn-helix domain-containing protein [Atlantibacter hermannii]